MRVVTVSREFGSGGRELGQRLAEILGFDYYDSEIITAVAEKSGQDPAYVERELNARAWQSYPISMNHSLSSYSYIESNRVNLLLAQRQVIEEIAARGRDCLIVGRSADVILQDYEPFNLFVCASAEAKLRRCRALFPEQAALSDREMLKKITKIDKLRSQSRELMTGLDWGNREAYDLIVNASDHDPERLAPLVADYIRGCWALEEA